MLERAHTWGAYTERDIAYTCKQARLRAGLFSRKSIGLFCEKGSFEKMKSALRAILQKPEIFLVKSVLRAFLWEETWVLV